MKTLIVLIMITSYNHGGNTHVVQGFESMEHCQSSIAKIAKSSRKSWYSSNIDTMKEYSYCVDLTNKNGN